MRNRHFIPTFLLFSTALFADPSLLPLKEGNFWTYRERGGQNSFTIRVGAAVEIGGNVYHELTGYTTEPVRVRFGDHGALYFRDAKLDRDALLTSFEPFTSGWFNAPLRICEELGQVQDKHGAHAGPAGPFSPTLLIQYRTFGCADIGDVEEQYAANVGMVERTVQSFIGPRVYELVSARVGASTIQTAPGATFTVSTQRAPGGLLATLELKLTGPAPAKLRFNSSQNYDLVLRDADGNNLWRWSMDKLFLPVVREEETLGHVWQVEVPVDLRPGAYTLDAWVLSGPEQRQFAASTPIQIQ